jgi:hypothetical protein
LSILGCAPSAYPTQKNNSFLQQVQLCSNKTGEIMTSQELLILRGEYATLQEEHKKLKIEIQSFSRAINGYNYIFTNLSEFNQFNRENAENMVIAAKSLQASMGRYLELTERLKDLKERTGF